MSMSTSGRSASRIMRPIASAPCASLRMEARARRSAGVSGWSMEQTIAAAEARARDARLRSVQHHGRRGRPELHAVGREDVPLILQVFPGVELALDGAARLAVDLAAHVQDEVR